MDININFDTKRKLMIKFFKHENDNWCEIFMFIKAWHLRLLWFSFEINIPSVSSAKAKQLGLIE